MEKCQCGNDSAGGSSKRPVKIGIIGGSGLDDPDILLDRQEKSVQTPYGDPSDVLIEGKIVGIDCVLLARHGRKHGINPGNINYRANIWALKKAGCTHVIGSNACGSLQEHLKQGDLVIPTDILDRTTGRPQTFHDGGAESPKGVCHLPMFPVFSEGTRRILIQTANELNYTVHEKAVVVVIEGPRYSSRAESNMYRILGGDLVNMTLIPEVILAKEAGLLYATVAIATDYDCWRDAESVVTTEEVKKTFAQNVGKIKNIIMKAVENIGKADWTEERKAAKELIRKNTNVL